MLVFLTSFLLTVVPTHAGVGEGPYLTLTGTINMYEDMNLTDVSTQLDPIVQDWGSYLNIDWGLGFNHSIGYSFGSAFSMEVEFASQGGKFGRACSKVGCEEGQKSKLDGDVETKSLMVNAIHFFNADESFSPYFVADISVAYQMRAKKSNFWSSNTASMSMFSKDFITISGSPCLIIP